MSWLGFVENGIRSYLLDNWHSGEQVLLNATDLSMDSTDNSLNSTSTDLSNISGWAHVMGFTSPENWGFFKVSSAATNKLVFDTSYRTVSTEAAGDNVEVLEVFCPIKFPNTPFKVPTDPSTDKYVHFTIDFIESFLAGMSTGREGDGMYRTTGFIGMEAHSPLFRGVDSSMIDLFSTILRKRTIASGVKTYSPRGDTDGFDNGEGWWVRLGTCDFRYDHHFNSSLIQQEGNMLLLEQSGHGFSSTPAAAYLSAENTWTPARANADATMAHAIVVGVSGNWLKIATSDIHWMVHNLGTTGQLYLSQDTAGGITTTRPTSGRIQSLGQIMSARRILVNIGPWS